MKVIKKYCSIILSIFLFSGTIVTTHGEEDVQRDLEIRSISTSYVANNQLNVTFENFSMLSSITAVKVGTEHELKEYAITTNSAYSMPNNTYFKRDADAILVLQGDGIVTNNYIIFETNTGTTKVKLLRMTEYSVEFEKPTVFTPKKKAEETVPVVTPSPSDETESQNSQKLTQVNYDTSERYITFEPSDIFSQINRIYRKRQGENAFSEMARAQQRYAITNSNQYYRDNRNQKIYFDNIHDNGLLAGDIFKIVHDSEILGVFKFNGTSFELLNEKDNVTDSKDEDSSGEEETTVPDNSSKKQIDSANYITTFSDSYFTIVPEAFLSEIDGIKIDNLSLTKGSSKYTIYGRNEFFIDQNDKKIYINELRKDSKIQFLKGTTVLGVFQFRYTDKSMTKQVLDKPSQEDTDPKQTPSTPNKDTKVTSVSWQSDGFDKYLMVEPENVFSQIDNLELDGVEMVKVSSKIIIDQKTKYALDSVNKRIYLGDYFSPRNRIKLKHGDTVLGMVEYTNKTFKIIDENMSRKVLKLRLTGKFEAALVDQRKYDSVTAATGSASTMKNSNVSVEVAEVEHENDVVPEDAWKKLKDHEEVYVENTDRNIVLTIQAAEGTADSNDSGMTPQFNNLESEVTLNGIPKDAGTYHISMSLTDAQGRHVTSNPLPFKVYNRNVTLKEQLKTDNMAAINGGTAYSWDIMEPWQIQEFGGTDETVTVPQKMKLWFGSHTSGIYGRLGRERTLNSSAKPTQKLILEEGTNLYLINMYVTGNVEIIVKHGAKLHLHDSSIHGIITVEEGGTFSMNYDDNPRTPEDKRILSGAQINGQLVMKDGSILENSVIYSNTNYLADNKYIRRNENPVVHIDGNVEIKGNVFIRGDEAATGKDGQPAIEIRDGGSLNITADSVLGVYGGGSSALTVVGAPAIKMDNATIKGEGKLIAVGGNSHSANGSPAIKGSGKLEVKEAYIRGGSTSSNDRKPGPALNPKEIIVSDATVGYALDGISGRIEGNPEYFRITTNPSTLNDSKTNTAGAPALKESLRVQNDTNANYVDDDIDVESANDAIAIAIMKQSDYTAKLTQLGPSYTEAELNELRPLLVAYTDAKVEADSKYAQVPLNRQSEVNNYNLLLVQKLPTITNVVNNSVAPNVNQSLVVKQPNKSTVTPVVSATNIESKDVVIQTTKKYVTHSIKKQTENTSKAKVEEKQEEKKEVKSQEESVKKEDLQTSSTAKVEKEQKMEESKEEINLSLLYVGLGILAVGVGGLWWIIAKRQKEEEED